ncbi:PD-(D/E)XK nuclease family protein [candidate division WOR-3 bacterium]|nr:PD-(D/E)XK nuclease family protein [candidate division WOR-3 bacterium]
MIKWFDFTPILGWSVSRYDKFNLCKRQYYYDYYAKYDKVYPIQKIKALKKLTSIPLEMGNIVHQVVKVLLERLLKSEEAIDESQFIDFAKRKTQEHCNSKTFSEVYYKEINRVDAEVLFGEIHHALNNFLSSKRYDWLTEKAISNKLNWIIEPSRFGETRLEGMKIYCKVDFLFPVNDYIYIIDWKTGKRDEEKYKKQLLGYTCWASYHLEKDPNKIIPTIAYLRPSYEEVHMKFNEYDIQDFAIQIKEETEEMYSWCRNIEENIPQDKDKFIKTTNNKICNYCNYRELCR